jgi:GNAT superfamily N-acetyltransferase
LLKVVITGPDPVIHALGRVDPLDGEGVDGRIKSGHDAWRGGHVVAVKAETTITLTDAPDDDERAVVAEGLRAYNEAQAGYSDSRALAVLVRDPETKKVVGGLHGRTSLGLLRVERFFLPEDLRRARLGSRILAMAEDEGRRRGCTRAVLSTVHFQAPGFYLKQGWEVAARIECEPPGHTRFYMTKKLS